MNNDYTNYTISFDPSTYANDFTILSQNLAQETLKAKELPPTKPFGFFIKDTAQTLHGGIAGALHYNCLCIQALWIEPQLRKKGLGQQLLQQAENFAVQNGCTFASADVMEWQALPFYLKSGYHIEFVREGYSANSKCYTLKKILSPHHPKSQERFKCFLVVSLLLEQDGKILLIERANTGFGDGHYALPGGGVDGRERLKEAACREAKEEIGIDIAEEDLELAQIIHACATVQSPDEKVLFVFKTSRWSGQVRNTEPHKCSGLMWIAPHALPQKILPASKMAITATVQHKPNGIVFSDLGWLPSP